jgi:hypothetical protein
MLPFGYLAFAVSTVLLLASRFHQSGQPLADKICYYSGACDEAPWIAFAAAVFLVAMTLWQMKIDRSVTKTGASIPR